MATNLGTANTYPVFRATGPGKLYHLINYETGETIYFDIDLGNGEEVVLDLRPGKKTFESNFRGNIIHTILDGSDTDTFHLIPGENNISIFIDDATATASLLWEERHWGFDGVVG